MAETTYLPQVRCEVSEGLTETDITVCVRDVTGRDQYIHVLPSMVNWSRRPYLPGGVINVNRPVTAAPHQLPLEAIPA